MKLSEADELVLDELLGNRPRAPVRGLRKLSATVAVRTSYTKEYKVNRPDQDWYEVEVWHVDTQQGARWVRARTSSQTHRTAVSQIKALLQMYRLHQLVEGNA